ncbi:MAG TPA: phage holin family protein [Nocardioidaceae bacterium]
MKFIVRVIVDALAIALATWLVDGITLTGRTQQDQIITLVLVALIFGVVNAIIAPVVKLLSLPFIILTLGLLLFVINALMLWLTSAISEAFGLGFHVAGFWPAVLGAVIVMVATWVLEAVLPDGR